MNQEIYVKLEFIRQHLSAWFKSEEADQHVSELSNYLKPSEYSQLTTAIEIFKNNGSFAQVMDALSGLSVKYRQENSFNKTEKTLL